MPNLTPIGSEMHWQYIPDGVVVPLSTAQKITLATRYDRLWLQWGREALQNTTTLLGSPMFGPFAGLVTDLKKLNPNLKVGFYAGGIFNIDSIWPSYEWMDNTAYLMHSSIGADAKEFTASTSRRLLVNPSSSVVINRLAKRWAALVKKYDLDGLMFDNCDPAYFAALSTRTTYGIQAGSLEGAVDSDLWWAPHMFNLLGALKTELNKLGARLCVVGLGDASASQSADLEEIMGVYNTNLVSHADEIIAESVPLMYNNATVFAAFIDAIQRVSRQGKYTFFSFQPKSNLTVGVDYTENQLFRRWALATYLLIKSAYTYFHYYPHTPYLGLNPVMVGGAYYEQYVHDEGDDWNLTIGEPTGDAQLNVVGTAPTWWREFLLPSGKNVYAVVNTSKTQTGNFGVDGSYKDWDPTSGTPITVSGGSYTVAAATGHLLFEQ